MKIEFEDWQVQALNNYFALNDKTALEHWAYDIFNKAVIHKLTMQEVLNYEVHSHCFSSWIGFEWGQNLMGKYFAWKVRRKYNRYLVSLEERNRVLKRK